MKVKQHFAVSGVGWVTIIHTFSDPSTSFQQITWTHTQGDHLSLSSTQLLTPTQARHLLQVLEQQVVYPEDSQVRVRGRWHRLPRQQAAFGDPAQVYRFSGTEVRAQPWLPELVALRDRLESLVGTRFNFVLVNRYRDGDAYIGEHRDAEATLDPKASIASLSLGVTRDFVLRHTDARRPVASGRHRDVPVVRMPLTDGMLLLMNPPTNTFWYHSLPRRRRCAGLRISLTFRKLL